MDQEEGVEQGEQGVEQEGGEDEDVIGHRRPHRNRFIDDEAEEATDEEGGDAGESKSRRRMTGVELLDESAPNAAIEINEVTSNAPRGVPHHYADLLQRMSELDLDLAADIGPQMNEQDFFISMKRVLLAIDSMYGDCRMGYKDPIDTVANQIAEMEEKLSHLRQGSYAYLRMKKMMAK